MLKRKKYRTAFVTHSVLFWMGLVFISNPYLVNNTTNFRPHYWWIENKDFIFSPNYTFLGYTPDDHNALHFLYHVWLGMDIKIETTTYGSYKPKQILHYFEENFDAPTGPLKKNFDIACTKDSRYIVLIQKGWYVDCYDFKKQTNIKLDMSFFGKISETDMNKWKAYHQKVNNLVGQDTISILNKLKQSQEQKK